MKEQLLLLLLLNMRELLLKFIKPLFSRATIREKKRDDWPAQQRRRRRQNQIKNYGSPKTHLGGCQNACVCVCGFVHSCMFRHQRWTLARAQKLRVCVCVLRNPAVHQRTICVYGALARANGMAGCWWCRRRRRCRAWSIFTTRELLEQCPTISTMHQRRHHHTHTQWTGRARAGHPWRAIRQNALLAHHRIYNRLGQVFEKNPICVRSYLTTKPAAFACLYMLRRTKTDLFAPSPSGRHTTSDAGVHTRTYT